ncbi:MAG: twin-arginine translocation signal domain-containing protein [Bacteroidota bacterium]|nr:twin-arginine translocation signal domain-containing protein [Bacteroidota bacterium]HHU97164.1 twin-arginine translocation signal domain-containing protein [Petrimonas sp.]
MTLTRRSFIKTSAALAAGLAVPTYLKAGTLSSSDRVNMALWVKQPANLPLTI